MLQIFGRLGREEQVTVFDLRRALGVLSIDIEQDASRLRRFLLEKLLIIFIDISRFPDPLTQVLVPLWRTTYFILL